MKKCKSSSSTGTEGKEPQRGKTVQCTETDYKWSLLKKRRHRQRRKKNDPACHLREGEKEGQKTLSDEGKTESERRVPPAEGGRYLIAHKKVPAWSSLRGKDDRSLLEKKKREQQTLQTKTGRNPRAHKWLDIRSPSTCAGTFASRRSRNGRFL